MRRSTFRYMPLPSSRPDVSSRAATRRGPAGLHAGFVWCAFLLFGMGCSDRRAGAIELRGDVDGLETLGERGDSLLDVSRLPAMLTDSGIVVLPDASDTLPRRPGESGADTARPAAPLPESTGIRAYGNDAMARYTAAEEMTRRALARSDSLARLDARNTNGAGMSGRTAGADTLRGILTVTTREGTREYLLESGGRRVALSGVAMRGVAALNGLEVMVRGVAITSRDLAVSALIVRAWQSFPAVDGVVLADGALRLTDGSGVVQRPLPPALRPLVGARVWVAYRDGRPVQFDRMEW